MNKTLGKVSGGGRLGLCFTAMLGFAGSGYAAEEAIAVERFELKIVERSVGAKEILAGEFSAAVEKINSSLSLDSEYAKNTNLCAAYTAQGKFASAQPYCQAAVTSSRSSQYGLISMARLYTERKNLQAMALNNFGVWHAMQGNAGAAQAYFQSAGDKSKGLSATSNRNIDVLEQRMGSATVAAS